MTWLLGIILGLNVVALHVIRKRLDEHDGVIFALLVAVKNIPGVKVCTDHEE